MVGISFTNWSLITPPKFIGLDNFTAAFGDEQFWVSLGYTLKYTLLHHADPDDRRLPARAARVAEHAAASDHAGDHLHPGRHRPRRLEPALGLAVRPDVRTHQQGPVDLGLIDQPIQWLGVDADLSTWSIIASVAWKVLGFGMILFVAAIQAIPSEINEATMVDGASFWQRTRRVTVPLTRRTILLVTLVSVIGSLLAFDQFYIMTAGQPFNQTATAVFYIYLNSFPYLQLGYGAALSLILAAIILVLHDRPDGPDPPERGVTAVPMRAPLSRAWSRVWGGRNRYLVGAVCLTICVFMADADRPVDARVGEDDGRGGGGPADLLPARAQPRQLRAAVDVPGRACRPISSTASRRRS